MSVTIDPAVVAPASYRLATFWPSQLKLYLECPERYYHKYVARRRGVESFSRDLARGIALHAVLADCFTEYQRTRGFPMRIRERVERQLRQVEYPPELEAGLAEDVESVTAWVKWVLSEFDCTTEVLGVEQTLSFYFRGAAPCPACLFRAKVDLVLAHPDGSLEHVDLKGGRVRSDPIQEVLTRIVVGAEHGERHPVIRTTTLFAAERRRVSAVLERDAYREIWETIKRAVTEIQAGGHWTPSPSPFCGTCPYFGNGCSISIEPTGAGDPIAWLDAD